MFKSSRCLDRGGPGVSDKFFYQAASEERSRAGSRGIYAANVPTGKVFLGRNGPQVLKGLPKAKVEAASVKLVQVCFKMGFEVQALSGGKLLHTSYGNSKTGSKPIFWSS